jgi:hypothetical protein
MERAGTRCSEQMCLIGSGHQRKIRHSVRLFVGQDEVVNQLKSTCAQVRTKSSWTRES